MDRRIVLTKTAKGLMEATGKTSRLARDETLAAKLWSVSEDLTGVRFDLGS